MIFPVARYLERFEHCSRGTITGSTIVPPSWHKTQHWQGFAHIWRRAAEELSSAENILVMGYSMPQTDSFFRDLFALGLASRTPIKRFIVVNPDKTLEERFRGLLGPQVRDRFEFWPEKFEDVLENRRLAEIDW